MRRGAYTFDKTTELKFRGSQDLYNTIKTLAEQKETTMAAVMRGIVEQQLRQREAEGHESSKA